MILDPRPDFSVRLHADAAIADADDQRAALDRDVHCHLTIRAAAKTVAERVSEHLADGQAKRNGAVCIEHQCLARKAGCVELARKLAAAHKTIKLARVSMATGTSAVELPRAKLNRGGTQRNTAAAIPTNVAMAAESAPQRRPASATGGGRA